MSQYRNGYHRSSQPNAFGAIKTIAYGLNLKALPDLPREKRPERCLWVVLWARERDLGEVTATESWYLEQYGNATALDGLFENWYHKRVRLRGRHNLAFIAPKNYLKGFLRDLGFAGR